MSLIRFGVAVMAVSSALAVDVNGWHYERDNPQTTKHVVWIDAKAMERANDSPILQLEGMVARVYRADGVTFREIESARAVFDEKSGILHYGPGLSKQIDVKNLTGHDFASQ